MSLGTFLTNRKHNLHYNISNGLIQQTTSYELSMVVPETGGLGLRLSFYAGENKKEPVHHVSALSSLI